MRKFLYCLLFAVMVIICIVFVVWARTSGNRWMIYVVPPLVFAAFCVIVYYVGEAAKKIRVSRGNGGWPAKASIELWDQTYEVDVTVKRGAEDIESAAGQAVAYERFHEMIVNKKTVIEQMLEEYYMNRHEVHDKQILSLRFKPDELVVKKDASYVLLGIGPGDGTDKYFALLFGEQIQIMTLEKYRAGYK